MPRQVTADGVLYGKRVKDLSQLANDDELAAEEAAAQAGIPGETPGDVAMLFGWLLGCGVHLFMGQDTCCHTRSSSMLSVCTPGVL